MISTGGSLEADVFFTHTHLDHIIGLPFFAPIFQPETRLRIYGPVTCEDESLETVTGGQLSCRYFPVRQQQLAAREENRRLADFFADADLLIHAAPYTQQEYDASRKGWGHSPIEYAIKAALRSEVKRLALFHHDPMRTDAQLDELTKMFCDGRHTGGTAVFFAREGMPVQI